MAQGDMMETGMQPAYGPSGEKIIPREKPKVPEARRKLVTDWLEKIGNAKKHWEEKDFKRMNEDMDYAEGYQVNGKTSEESDSYVANMVLSHVNDRVATLYAKNPKAVAKRVPRMDSLIWDGEAESVAPIDQRMALSVQGGIEPSPEDLQFMAEVARVLEERKMIDGVGKTLEILFHYFTREGIPPFKTQMKQLVRRAETCSVGYLKLGFQRVMEPNVEIQEKLADFSAQLAHIEMLAADMADEEFAESDRQAEELREAIAVMQTQVEVIAREGLVFDFPDAMALIVDTKCKHIRGFVGAEWLAEMHKVSPDEIKERFRIDIGTEYNAHKPIGSDVDDGPICVWYELYDLKSGVVRHMVDGYCDFLEEPKGPPFFMEQGHPYFALTFNNVESRKTPFPPSDVRLLRSMQDEINRAEEGIREHRIASRPGYMAGGTKVGEEDVKKFANREAHEILEFSVPTGTDMSKIVVPIPTIQIDPLMYDTERHFVNMQRVTKSQESNFGGVAKDVTATGASIAETTRLSGVSSNVDDLDDFLTAVARASGQALLAEMSIEMVQKIAGQGAVWPELSGAEIAEEIFLEIKAGSSGAPNAAQELANFERAAPYLLQIPGINPKKLGEYVLERLDVSIDLDEWIVAGLPSIQAMNAMAKAVAPPGAGPDNPDAQGPQGAENTEQPPATPGGPQPQFPAAGEASRVMQPGVGPLQ